MMETPTTASVYAVHDNWLDSTTGDSVTLTNTSAKTANNLTVYGWPYGMWYYPVYQSEARPIKLTLSEIERLRKAAKADKALKAILAKFTSQIEITVDFE